MYVDQFGRPIAAPTALPQSTRARPRRAAGSAAPNGRRGRRRRRAPQNPPAPRRPRRLRPRPRRRHLRDHAPVPVRDHADDRPRRLRRPPPPTPDDAPADRRHHTSAAAAAPVQRHQVPMINRWESSIGRRSTRVTDYWAERHSCTRWAAVRTSSSATRPRASSTGRSPSSSGSNSAGAGSVSDSELARLNENAGGVGRTSARRCCSRSLARPTSTTRPRAASTRRFSTRSNAPATTGRSSGRAGGRRRTRRRRPHPASRGSRSTRNGRGSASRLALRLDLGGVGKGLAADLLARGLVDRGARSAARRPRRRPARSRRSAARRCVGRPGARPVRRHPRRVPLPARRRRDRDEHDPYPTLDSAVDRDYHHLVDPDDAATRPAPTSSAVVVAAARRVVGRRNREVGHHRRRRSRAGVSPTTAGVRAWLFLDDGDVLETGPTADDRRIARRAEHRTLVVRGPRVGAGRVGGRDVEHPVGPRAVDATDPAQGRAGVAARPAQVPRNAFDRLRRGARARALGRQLRVFRSARAVRPVRLGVAAGRGGVGNRGDVSRWSRSSSRHG